MKVISLAKTCRYQPLKEVSSGGIIILRDTQSDQPETFVELVKGIFIIKLSKSFVKTNFF